MFSIQYHPPLRVDCIILQSASLAYAYVTFLIHRVDAIYLCVCADELHPYIKNMITFPETKSIIFLLFRCLFSAKEVRKVECRCL